MLLEQPHTPMHVGSVYLFKQPTNGEPMTYLRFREHIRSRLHVSRVFRQRLVTLPFNVDRPYWVEDPHFDLELHLPHVGLPKPGNFQALMQLAADIFSRPLDKSRPLWEVTFVDKLDHVEGVPSDAFAIIAKMHHAAIDGVSGDEILGAILDTSTTPRHLVDPHTWHPDEVPSSSELLFTHLGSVAKTPIKLSQFAWQSSQALVSTAMKKFANAKKTGQKVRVKPAPDNLLSSIPTQRRTIYGTDWSLDTIKTMKNAIEGATVNDVMLAVCAGGLRRYLKRHNALPDDPLVAMTPISVRSASESGKGGNRISAMLVSLATQSEHPVDRLLWVQRSTRSSKTYAKAAPVDKLVNQLPSATAALAARLYAQWNLAEHLKPFCNLTISNIPGPQVPLYLHGAELIGQYGAAPIFDGMGLILVIMSYNGRLSLTATSCRGSINERHGCGTGRTKNRT